MREKEHNPDVYHKVGQSHGQGNLESLKIWQARVNAAGSVQRFLEIWAPRVVQRDVEIPRTPQIPPQRVEIRTLVGEIRLN